MTDDELGPPGRIDIVFYTRQLHNGGVDRVVFNLAEEFQARGLVPLILVDLDNPYSPFRTLIPAGIAYRVLGARDPVTRMVKLVRFLRERRPRAMMCTSFGFPNLYAVVARRLAGIPLRLMLTEHCFPSVDRAAPRPWQARYWFFPLAHYLYPHADSIVAVSRGTANDLADVLRIDPGSIECIYNPIVSDALIAQSREAVDHPWFTASDVPVVIAVGRLEPQKNFAMLIRAFAQVRATRTVKLLILGDGQEREMLETLVRTLGLDEDVAMPGFAPNPHAYVAKAALLVLSSDFESLANVVIEAMAVGTPVIATDCPSGPAEALAGGRYGTLIPVGDSDRLATEMLRVLSERAPAAPPADGWLGQFTTAHAADRYLELLTPAAA
ncbi:glycosyltransferase [Sphingomonas prati]|uniref:Glycosyltransferase involved in cell wall biosynthesis n=1 Tax=Sphingomonas prati TaxID=1843237 RepID=A0A7W9BTK7_9SPHN|nr:glycosyltransferase [Sphingomonas prati]MBB5729699.1 glycosyltransferase involved in cell wall biosynthesis [Sphingomonas prati]GGE90152.1 glycosyl transferase [Sphingomonas prati]